MSEKENLFSTEMKSGAAEEVRTEKEAPVAEEVQTRKEQKKPKAPGMPSLSGISKALKTKNTPKVPKDPKATETPKAPKAPKATETPKVPKAPGEAGSAAEFMTKAGGAVLQAGKKTGEFFKGIGRKLAPLMTRIGKATAPARKRLKVILVDISNGSFFSIRNKLLIGFLVPIFFMIIIAVVSYNKAQDGMRNKFAESTVQTIKMVQENVDSNCEFIRSVGTSLMLNSDLKDVLTGKYKSDAVAESKVFSNLRTQLIGYPTGNKFIKHVHIIPSGSYRILSTSTTGIKPGIRDEYRNEIVEENGFFPNWVDRHAMLDEILEMKESDYIMSYQVMSNSDLAVILADISPDAVLELLGILDLGEGSVVGFVSPGGRELIKSRNKKISEDGNESVFFGQDFFNEAAASQDTTGVSDKIRYKGRNYMFFFSRSELTGSMVCALVPISTITDQAQDIRVVSVIMVMIACLVVIGIAAVLIAGIQTNMKKISTGFGEVAEGDLTVEVSVNGQDEFNSLADSANHMVKNTKKLVGKVNDATMHLEESAESVKNASETISGYSYDISKVVEGINSDLENQASHAKECVERTGALSQEIQEMARIIGNIESGVHETEEMIGNGVEKVQRLGKHAQQTTDITMEVGQSIENLKAETAVINKFVAMITEISSQTNLLSLNASIEAARAGDAGRGFSVVAAEIRKLADDSARAAGEIKSNVGHIISKAQESVESAEKAREMVDSQTEVVGQVIEIFKEMSQKMEHLTASLREVMEHTKKTDAERERTIQAVDNISGIIDDTVENTDAVTDAVSRLMASVENLNAISNVLDENMNELKTEISSFKTE